MLETIKQQVAINKIVKRNREMEQGTPHFEEQNKGFSGSFSPQKNGQVIEIGRHFLCKRLQIPFYLVKMKGEGKFSINMNEDWDEMIIDSSKKFKIFTENHIYEALGLTTTNEGELQEFFSEDINHYLKTAHFMDQSLEQQKEERSFKLQKHKSIEENQIKMIMAPYKK